VKSRFLSNKGFCKYCKIEVETPVCETCGRKVASDADSSNFSLGLIIFATAALLGLVYWISQINFHQWFPDQAKADEQMRHAHSVYADGNAEQAMEEAQKAIDYAPNNGALHYEFAHLLSKEDRVQRAFEEAKLAADLSPKDVKIQEYYADIIEQVLGQRQEVLDQYERMIKNFPNYAPPYYWAAQICENLSKYELGAKYYADFIKLDPDNIDGSWIGLARCLAKQDKINEAAETLKQATKKVPRSIPVREELAELLEQTGDKSGAIQELQTVVSISPSSADRISPMIAKLLGDKAGSYSIPLTREGQSYYVDVVLNNKVHAKLIVDSGAEVVLLSSEIAKKLGIDSRSAEPVIIQGATGRGIAYRARLDSVTVGKASEKHVVAMFQDLPIAGGDGLLGMTFLGRYSFSLDAKHNILRLTQKAISSEEKGRASKTKPAKHSR
jgi:clan AA aspartic protease (TIGR02281 family)